MRDADEELALTVATWNPAHAIEGWRQGHLANGDEHDALVMARALEIQRQWREDR